MMRVLYAQPADADAPPPTGAPRGRKPAPIGDRTIAVLVLAAAGCGEQETAGKLGISRWTVHNERKTLRQHFGARTTCEAVAIAFREGILR